MAPLLRMRNIHKSFSGVPVLREVDFDLNEGEVHILAGENGAGKSTLIKILAGVHAEFQGTIEIDGRAVRLASPHDAAGKGISVIHQELSLIDPLPVVDNIFLGREITSPLSPALMVDRARQLSRARELCSQLDLDIDLRKPVETFPISVKNRIEIAKALAFNARILVMDEPTSALNVTEVDRLFRILAGLKDRGCGIIYITHRMEEIYRIGDRITVLRDGCKIGTARCSELGEAELVRWMIGREISTCFPERRARLGNERLRVEHFSVAKPGATSTHARQWLVKDVSFEVRDGEIVGIAGLQGSGNSDLLAGLFGAHPGYVEGSVRINDRNVPRHSPRGSIRHRLAYLPSDRKGSGLILGMDIVKNITLASLKKRSPWGLLRPREETDAARERVRSLSIRAASLSEEVQTLSGGNQQKVMLAKWVETSPEVLLLDEPTRGVDVGAKHEIYELIRRWTGEGIAVVLITSELQELIGLADRILVMHRGRISAELTREQATQERVTRAAMGEAWMN